MALTRRIRGTTCSSTHTSDVVIGLVQGIYLRGIIALVSCYKGMSCGEGAEGVGRATTEAVVIHPLPV